ncbi:MAG: N-acetylglucosamine-6-phosphate deacetylase [Paracoccus sp. (in: a-proteobacteria)]|uniref:N-acetylglucosamine-6-phosphate deacetylase n=1 Tax=Paracoccus sp. TaxID=267 RepID=UPI0026DFAEDD|nr:N-acetylglucosamine-6-phosphate deacetylase [Paracoccus sp. (in: a-proteobacteria)]MDO5612306.1 N-acetylglucosamine-6-phosphate deacetylase [Paracoccus sp. (in: a-proteobacteria)]
MSDDQGAYWLVPARLFDGETMRNGVAIRLRGAEVLEWAAAADLGGRADLRHHDGIAAPGLIDLQVNGGGGVLLNTTPTPQGLRAIAAAHRGLGCAFCLPTLITDAPEVLDRATDAMLALWSAPDRSGVAGLHIEGPHISLAKRGTHDPRFIRPLDDRTLTCVARLRDRGVPLLITVAPEACAPGQIARLAAMGAVVSIGHSAATPDQIARAMAEGARKGTHLYNGMTGMAGREPGVAGALIDSDLWLGLIADGHHVSDQMIRLAWRARPAAGRMILVSDAMPTVGGPDRFTLYGQVISVTDGKLVNAEGSLAGVHMALPQALPRVTRILGDDGTQALTAASATPAELMGLSGLGHLRPGATGGVTLLAPDLTGAEWIGPASASPPE